MTAPHADGTGLRAQLGSLRKREVAERLLGPQTARRLWHMKMDAVANWNNRFDSLARQSASQLRSQHDAFRGKTCAIIGNGPSLNETNVQLLRSVDTFGLNRVYLAFPRWGFETTYHVAINRLVVEQCSEELGAVGGQLFTMYGNRSYLHGRPDICLLQDRPGPAFYGPSAAAGVWQGATVTYVAMQLAYYLGYSRVLLVGVDHRFATRGPAHKRVVATGDDPNHFDPQYFGKGFAWQLPDLETSEVAYRLAELHFRQAGREIIDCTIDGALTVFRKSTLESELQ